MVSESSSLALTLHGSGAFATRASDLTPPVADKMTLMFVGISKKSQEEALDSLHNNKKYGPIFRTENAVWSISDADMICGS